MMVVLGVVSYSLTWKDYKPLAAGYYYNTDTSEMETFGDTITESALRGRAFFNALVSGICCPTFLYLVTMTILAVVWFVARPDSRQ